MPWQQHPYNSPNTTRTASKLKSKYPKYKTIDQWCQNHPYAHLYTSIHYQRLAKMTTTYLLNNIDQQPTCTFSLGTLHLTKFLNQIQQTLWPDLPTSTAHIHSPMARSAITSLAIHSYTSKILFMARFCDVYPIDDGYGQVKCLP